MIQINFRRLLLNKQQEENNRISFEDISRETGISRQSITQWDEGNIRQFNADVLVAFCQYFSCQIGDLIEYINGNGEKSV